MPIEEPSVDATPRAPAPTPRATLERPDWLGAVAIAAFVCLPLLRGFPMGHDWAFELVRAWEYRMSFEAGQIPPDWAPHDYAGYGSPVFLFYAPLFSRDGDGRLLGCWVHRLERRHRAASLDHRWKPRRGLAHA
jgi:hypothetical protein